MLHRSTAAIEVGVTHIRGRERVAAPLELHCPSRRTVHERCGSDEHAVDAKLDEAGGEVESCAVVEAAGVEPASEGTFPKDSTCVSASLISHPSCESGEKPPGARPGMSHDQAPSRHLIASPFK